MAPKTASGASFMMKPTIAKTISCACSTAGRILGTLVRPRWSRAAPTRQARTRTWSSEFSAKAPTALSGSACSRNSLVDGSDPPPVFVSTAPASSFAGSMFMPAPGCMRLPARRPMSRAKVVATSNQTRALRPIRPNARRFPALAMPVTTTQNTSGAMTALMSLTKPSPSGWTAVPTSGQSRPTSRPSTRARPTCRNSEVRSSRAARRGRDGDGTDSDTGILRAFFRYSEGDFRNTPVTMDQPETPQKPVESHRSNIGCSSERDTRCHRASAAPRHGRRVEQRAVCKALYKTVYYDACSSKVSSPHAPAWGPNPFSAACAASRAFRARARGPSGRW